MKDIRHIATSFSGNRIAFAEFEKEVQIFDIDTLEIIKEFTTILSFGGERLAINESGDICICGAWSRYGICGYNANTGAVIWQRRDLKKVQCIQMLHSNPDFAFASFDLAASRILNIKNGIDVEKIPNVKGYFESRFDSIDVYDRSISIDIINRRNRKRVSKIDRKSFATLDLIFNRDSFCISESAGPLSCYNLNNGSLKWRINAEEGEHYLRITYNETINKYIGITWPYFYGGDKKVKYINPDSGKVENEINIKRPVVTEFAKNGKILITSDRQLINLENGEIKNCVQQQV